MKVTACTLCGGHVQARGLCWRHYQQARRRKSVTVEITDAIRLAAKAAGLSEARWVRQCLEVMASK